MNNKPDLVVSPAGGMGGSIGSQGDRRPDVHQSNRAGVPANYSAHRTGRIVKNHGQRCHL